MTRMLADGTGRLVYIGDSGTLSFLQLLRILVEKVAGPTPFSMGPAQHAVTEPQLSLSRNSPMTEQLPSKEMALILVDAFFVHVRILTAVFSIHD